MQPAIMYLLMEIHTAVEDAVTPTDWTLDVSDPASLCGNQFTNDLRQRHMLNHTRSNQHNPEYRLLWRTNDLASSTHQFQGKKRDDLKDILKLYQPIGTCGSYFDPTTKCQKKKKPNPVILRQLKLVIVQLKLDIW